MPVRYVLLTITLFFIKEKMATLRDLVTNFQFFCEFLKLNVTFHIPNTIVSCHYSLIHRALYFPFRCRSLSLQSLVAFLVHLFQLVSSSKPLILSFLCSFVASVHSILAVFQLYCIFYFRSMSDDFISDMVQQSQSRTLSPVHHFG